MSFPRYPAYKDSGVEWLGEVPEGWEICALRRLAQDIQTGPFGSQLHSSDYVQDQIPVINPSNIKHGRIVPDWACTITPEWAAALDQHALNAGDVVLARRGEMGRCAAITEAEAGWITGTGSVRIRLSFAETSAFWSYYLGTPFVREWLLLESVGATIDNVNASIVGRVPICAPPPAEQTAIATFLDRETAKIDALVDDYRSLIELLQEKRQAVISHAVTKGLDPTVPMKYSGVEWLGEVPEHWRVCTLRRVIGRIVQGWSPDCFAREAQDDEWGVLKAGCVNGGIFRASENKALPPELNPEPDYEVRMGDVLISRANGSPELVGSTAMVVQTRARLMLSDKIFRLSLHPSISAGFFVAVMNSRALRVQVENALSGGRGLANNLPQASLLSFFVAVPPVHEQAAIATFLDRETAKIGALITDAENAITLLQERRTALISAAVTGKIDVRGLAVQEAA